MKALPATIFNNFYYKILKWGFISGLCGRYIWSQRDRSECKIGVG